MSVHPKYHVGSIRLLLCISFFFTSILLPARGQSDLQIQDSLNRIVPDSKNTGPGLAIAVIKKGEVHFTKYSGMANIKQAVKIDSNSTFWIASVTKQFTAAAIYVLARNKKISLDSSVSKYLPELPAIYDNVKIKHLIHHTSGIRDGFVLTALSKKPPSEYTNENILHYLKSSTAFNFFPGSRFEYNNSGYVLLARIVEKVTGKNFPEFLEENIFLPLKMSKSYVSSSFPKDRNQAEGYRQNADGTFQEFHFEGSTYGSTGVVTTLSDLTRWSIFIQDPASIPSLAWLPEQLLNAGELSNGTQIAYAGGLERYAYRGNAVYEHFGSDEGFKADIIYFPATAVSIIGLTNNNNHYGLLELLFRVSDVVHGYKGVEQFHLKEMDTLLEEAYYFNNEEPQMVKVQRYTNYAKISSTPAGYEAPYKILHDTLQSTDPLYTQYITKGNYLQIVDSYYNINMRLDKIAFKSPKGHPETFPGEYFSKELQTSYKIISGKNGLQFEFLPGLAFDMFRLSDSDFVFEYQGPNFLQFSKNGLMFSREGVRHLVLERR